MKNKIYILLMVIGMLLIPNVLATCEEGQIDINTASLGELDEFPGIGEVKAQAIIDTRPFDSIDELIEVHGIGEITLQNIKDQGLACVDEEEGSSKDDSGELGKEEDEEEEKKDSSEDDERDKYIEISIDPPKETSYEAPETIILMPKTIKSENNNKNKEERFNVQNFLSYYSIQGLVIFCILIISLLTTEKIRKNKNEFR